MIHRMFFGHQTGAPLPVAIGGQTVMRTQAKLKLGYYPLALAEARRIRNYLQFPNEPASILDPCAGTGAALCALE